MRGPLAWGVWDCSRATLVRGEDWSRSCEQAVSGGSHKSAELAYEARSHRRAKEAFCGSGVRRRGTRGEEGTHRFFCGGSVIAV